MSFSSITRLFDRKQRANHSVRAKRREARRVSEWLRPRVPQLEVLEDRTLLAVIPPAQVALVGQLSPGGTRDNYNTPAISVNPVNSQRMVAAWIWNCDPIDCPEPNQQVFVRAAYSKNGGSTWANINLPATLVDPNTLNQNPALPFERATQVSVGWDRSNQIYFVYSEHTEDYTVGVVVLQKYGLTAQGDVNPTRIITDGLVYRWSSDETANNGAGYGAALNVTMVVDANLPTFTDPQTGETQTDAGSGNVYVAWNTNKRPSEDSPDNFNANSIELVVSSNGGNSFSAPKTVSPTGNIGNRHGAPRLVVSQGSADVPGGQVSLVWDNLGPLVAPPPGLDFIMSQRVPDNGAGAQVSCKAYTINYAPPPCLTIQQATDPGNGGDHVPKDTTSNLTVTLPATFGPEVTGFQVFINIESETVSEMSAKLVSPGGDEFQLFLNHVDEAGDTIDGQGVEGPHMGVIKYDPDLPGVPWDTIFTADAVYAINSDDAQAPYIGTFLPEGSLPLTPFDVSDANGTWQLVITKYRDDGGDPPSLLVNWGIKLTGKLNPDPAGLRVINPFPLFPPAVVGSAVPGIYPTKPAYAPDAGIGPNPVIASDNTLGSFSPFQGRLYIAYTGLQFDLPNTDIFYYFSDDGGGTWIFAGQINDDFASDGFSTGTRPQIQPNIVVDPYTGTVVASFLDFRYDPAGLRYVHTVTASIDGGATWNKQTWLNPTISAPDAITGKTVILQPIPGNQSGGNEVRDQLYNIGDHQALTVVQGKIFALWGTNQNGGRSPNGNNSGDQDTWLRQNIFFARATINAGPVIIDSTMGPAEGVNVSGFVFNNTFTAQGIPIVDGFAVTFDRRVDPGSFTTAAVQVKYRSYDPLANFVDIPVNQVIALNTNSLGATTFFIHFTTPQFATGTYSYVVLPIVRDRIRAPFGGGLGNFMDQNSNSVAGQPATPATGGDSYAAPTPNANGPNFLAPYDRDTLPIIVPGPYIAKTNVAGNPQTVDNVVINKYVTSIDVTFDRDMQPGSITPATILRMYGVVGSINGPFTVTPNPLGTDPDPSFPRTYRIGFPEQKVSGTYTITFASSPKAKGGRELDTNKNAGVDILFQKPTAGTEPKTYANGTDFFIGPNATVVSTITVPDGFVIQGTTIGDSATPGFDINFPDVRFLSAKLIAPDGTEILLFTKPGGNHPPPYNDVKGTILDDNAVTPQGGTNPIQSGSAPFGGRYNPQQPLSVLTGKLSSGTYRLILTNSSPTLSGTLNAWSLVLQKAISLTGLGEPVADQATVSFRTFNVAKNLPISQQAWTAVGPASNNNNANSSRISGIAVDPSDPSGNTVYVAGASGGVWKTSNFMTSSPIGPTWIPLLDYGPVWSINVGGIAVFGRNNDPKQSMVFVSTGEADTAGQITGVGAGIMRSMDGGATWTQLDSTDNTLPFAQRDHRFAGASSFKIIVDPKPSPVGPNQAVVYAVIVGTDTNSELTVQGGIWKSVDSGAHWFRLTPAPNQLGYASPTDLVFVPSSGDANTGNLRLAYAAWRGKGVYISSNSGSGWTQLLGKVGNPLIRDPDNNSIPVADPPSDPNGAKGRIVLATPALSGSKAQDLSYQGWVYAYVVNTEGLTDGFYISKDFGQNWTKVKLGVTSVGVYNLDGLPVEFTTSPNQIPTNDDTAADVEQMSNNQGNYDISIAVNPLNPNIVYLGGAAAPVNPYTVIRVDLTGIADPHNLTAFNNFRNDGGKLWFQTEGSITLANPNEGKPYGFPPTSQFPDQPYLNLFRDPFSPFANPSTLNVGNPSQTTLITGWTNSGIRGAFAPWYPMDTLFGPIDEDFLFGSVDQHRVWTMIDPLTGHARLIFGDDQGLFTVVEREDGTFSSGVGTARTPIGPRNGNLQINQFYGGATQPSQGAADKGGSMFYGASQDNGTPSSDKDILKNGNLQWTGPGGDASWVETDQTGSGTVFHYKWPCCGGNDTDFFQVNNVGHTVGLLQQPNDPQWPQTGGSRFSVNPINPDQVVIVSQAGRVFRTGGLPGGYTWFVIGEPAASGGPFEDVPADALAFGAPDPSDPTQQTDNHIYIGNDAGNIFVTFDGGGHWIKFTTADGLDGTPVQSITTNPKRGTHEAYAVTRLGIYWMKDSAAPGAQWVNITGNIFANTHNPFGDPGLVESRIKFLSAIVGDWRYSILDNPNQPNGLTHPILYVAGTAGVFRSLDKGQTWTNFPNVANDGAPAKGGYLPNAHITRLELSLGNINPVTGFPDAATSEDMLVAHTYGRGSWMIRLKPINPIEQAFVRGLDAQIYAQKVDANGNPVGGYFLTAPGTFQSFVVGRGPNKYPQLFAMGGDNQVYTQKFDGSGNSAGPWTLTAGGVFKSVVTGNLPSGALQIFTVGFDNQVYSLKFDVSGNPVGGFFATQPLAVKQLVVGRDSINRPQLFAVGTDNQVYTQKFGKQGNSASPWILTSPAQFKSVQVGNDLSGRPETFVIGFDDNVYYQKYDSNGLPTGNYLPLPQKFVSHVVVGHDALNNPQVFVRGRDDLTVYSLKLDANGNPTGGYFLASPGQVKTLDVGYDLNNIPELFVIGLDDQIYFATFFANGQPAAPYKLLSPGKVLGLKVTK